MRYGKQAVFFVLVDPIAYTRARSLCFSPNPLTALDTQEQGGKASAKLSAVVGRECKRNLCSCS